MATLTSIDPGTGEALGAVETATRSAVAQAVEEAAGAQPGWHDVGFDARASVLQRFRHLLAERRDEAAHLITEESGKPLAEAMMADVLTTLETAKHLAKHGAAILEPQKVRLSNPILFDRRSRVERHPLGVVGIIAPWNYPLSIPATGVLTALAAGNSVVLKPSEETPLIGDWLVWLLHEAGVPEGALQIVHGRGPVGASLVEAPIDGLLFTGSVPTGQKVAAGCGKKLLPAILELGGKDPMVVLPEANFEGAVSGALWGSFTNAGQTCASVERLYVPESERREYAYRLADAAGALEVGHGVQKGVQMGPLINDAAVKRVIGQIKDAEKAGASLLCGGDVREDLGPRFVAPTVLTDVPPEAAVMVEETFGPVLPVAGYAHIDDAVASANASDFGLTASVWGPSKKAAAIAQKLEAGTVTVNECVYTYAAAETPWSGWKQSGVGATHGAWGLEEVTRLRHVHRAPSGKNRSPWHYPYDDDLDRFLDDGIQFLHGKGRRRLGGAGALPAWLKRR